jgi:hypothetical protein
VVRGLKEEREREKDGPTGVGRKRGKGRGKRISLFLNSFQIHFFKLSNFNQIKNHAFES